MAKNVCFMASFSYASLETRFAKTGNPSGTGNPNLVSGPWCLGSHPFHWPKLGGRWPEFWNALRYGIADCTL